MPDRDRLGAERTGRHAETLAAWWLRLPDGEVDLIARRASVLAFVEVKQRARLVDSHQAVTHASWRRIAHAAKVLAARHPQISVLDWRYDLVALIPRTWPRHNKDHWRPY